MIHILNDLNGLISSSGHILIAKADEYPGIYQKMVKSLEKNHDFEIVVRKSVVNQWFKTMSQRYPQGTFVFEEVDARGALARRWQMHIPEHVTNKDILEADLLSLDLSPQPGFGFDETILAHFYSPLMTARFFPMAQIAQLLQVVSDSKWQENQKSALLERIYRMRLEQWQQNASNSEQRELIDLFAEDPQKIKRQLMEFRVLNSYPQIGENLLGRMFGVFKALKMRLIDIEIEEKNIQDVVNQVTYYLNSLKIDSEEALKGLVNGVSGLLTVEFDVIEQFLIKNADWLSNDLLDQLEAKFEELSTKDIRRIQALRQRIRPPKPEKPDISWGVSEMLDWAVQHYLPYQTWCLEHEAFEQEMYTLGDVFSEWLVGCWSDVNANSGRMLFNFFPNMAKQLKHPGRVTLVLVVDNLGWAWAEKLKDVFKIYKYYPIHSAPYIAMAPTETEISKKCLLSGEVGYASIDDKKYKGMLENGWVPYFGKNVFQYLSDIGGLKKIDSIDASAYVVNYLAVDKALHKPNDEIGMQHSEHIQHLLEKMVENVHAFVEGHDLKEKIHIHVIADHGSTRIPEADIIPNELDQDTFKAEGFDICSHRHVRVSENKFKELPNNLKVDCFFLPANEFKNDANYLCARRANRFMPTSQNTYVHGGLLPEEVIVPHLVFEGATIKVDYPTVLLPNNQFRYRKEVVHLEIGNPNAISIENVRVSILNNNISSEPVKIKEIKAKSKVNIEIEARFGKTSLPEDQIILRLRIRFACRGEDFSQDTGLDIVMRSMVEQEKTDLFDV